MSATIPLPVRADLSPHELFARAWAPTPTTAMQTGPVVALLAALGRRLRDASNAWRDRRRIHGTRVALMNLDDATLRDIGFVRAEIESVAAETSGAVEVTRARLLARVEPIAH